MTVIVAIIAYFTLYDFPETASFLTEEERAFVVYRLKYQGASNETVNGMRVGQDDTFQWKFVKSAFLDWQIWTNIWVYWGTSKIKVDELKLTSIGIVCPLYGISLFLPSIIRGLGYTSSTAQLLTVPIYITASVLAVAVAWWSDRVGKRYPFILVCLCIMAVGFIMCVTSATPGVIYAGVFIAACALYPAFPGNITWLSNSELYPSTISFEMLTFRRSGWIYQACHRPGHSNRCGQSCWRYVARDSKLVMPILTSTAMASNFYRTEDAPRYILGHALELGFIGAGILALLVLVFNYKRINAKRERQLSEGAHNGYTPEELGELGDRSMTFKYFL